MNEAQQPGRISRAVPRGLATTGPILFSYGFRPFFLGAGLWAIAAMALWIAALTLDWRIGGDYGSAHWHAHEMLFGFAPAVLAGFLLTAVPNWTGRLPVSGRPLALLFAIWIAGRLALLAPDITGLKISIAIDALFLPSLLFICAREVMAGRKWKDLKVVAGLLALSLANILFHVAVIDGEHAAGAARLAVGAYVMLIMIIGGRILPSFTRNWLNKTGRTDFPVPHNRFDVAAMTAGLLALGCWAVFPDETLTAIPALAAALLHAIRLVRWRGWTTYPEKLLLVLHVAYAFVPLGLAGIAAGAFGILGAFSVLHLLSVGAVATMMLAMMTRVTRGHTGRVLTASHSTVVSYLALIAAAIVRPMADVVPIFYDPLLSAAGMLWIAAFVLFCAEYAPMLLRVRRSALAKAE